MVGDRDDALAAGFDGYLPKPITPRTFAQTIESYLRSSMVTTESREA
jgi:CheY-like chemotaxis protein